jgi:phosphate starvation-inducible PhoH-like protein
MKATVDVPNTTIARILLGPNDSHQRQLRQRLNVKIVLRENKLLLDGEATDINRAVPILEKMIESINPQDPKGFLHEEFQWLLAGSGDNEEGLPDTIIIQGRKNIEPKSEGQRRYINAIRRNDIVFGIGPAGTGKTYLAVACAVEALKLGRVRKIILARPAVEAGEKLGFLPGDMQEKVNPYLRPLYDALEDMLSRTEKSQYLETGVIEVAPLAFMRGRTLNKAFVILDEAQNTTPGQMKMFLTRLGEYSRAIVTGDDTQVDLSAGEHSGLVHAKNILKSIKGVDFVNLTREDVVRHRLVKEIISAYETNGME